MVTTVIYAIIVMVAIIATLRFAHKIYPLDPVQRGKKVHIYQDGVYNRTATVTGLEPNCLIIYDAIPLPIHFRGRFYSTGYTSDGYTLIFIGRKRLIFLARFAEIIRKVVNTPEYKDNSPGEVPEVSPTEPTEGVEDEL